MVSTEKDTQSACLQYLASANIFHYRNNSGAIVSEYKGRKRFVRFGASGSPDIIVVYGGRYIGIEVKDIKGKQSESQIAFQKNLEKAGGAYYVVRSVDELVRIILNLKHETR